jgi:Protein of unknown function (DUF2917)
MRVDIERATMDFERMQIIRLRGARGVRLACRKGSFWITQEGVARDDFLVPGVSQEIETDGIVVIEAMLPSSLTIDSGKQPNAIVTARLEPRAA